MLKKVVSTLRLIKYIVLTILMVIVCFFAVILDWLLGKIAKEI